MKKTFNNYFFIYKMCINIFILLFLLFFHIYIIEQIRISTHYINDNDLTSNHNNTPTHYQEEPLNVSLENINNLNIVINNCTVGEKFFNDVCQELYNDGIKFDCQNHCINNYTNNAVIIVLDQTYSAGENTLIVVSSNNFSSSNSDALALAAKTAFYEKGFLTNNIECSNKISPLNLDTSIEKDNTNSLVVVSFGNYNVHVGITVAAIEATLTRYYSYIKNIYTQDDLIYCDANGKSNINSIVKDIRQFNEHVPTNLYIDKTLWSK